MPAAQQRSHECASEGDRHSGVAWARTPILVCDGAGWHQRGYKLTVPDNITLLPLPVISPELNSYGKRIDCVATNSATQCGTPTRQAVARNTRGSPWRFLIDHPDRVFSIAYRRLGTGQLLGALVLIAVFLSLYDSALNSAPALIWLLLESYRAETSGYSNEFFSCPHPV